MKTQKIAMIENVNKALKCVNYLENRPKTEMVGLGLFYGPPGVGKSRFARRHAFQHNHIYIRLESTSTAKTFATQLLESLKYKYNLTEQAKGSANKIYNECIEILQDTPDSIIYIDEIDYAFGNQALLGAIRDLVDETCCIVILIGMQDAYKQLLKANAHYFDRCNYFVNFTHLSIKDVNKICDEIAEVKFDQTAIEAIHKKTGGTLRKIVKLIHAIETYGREKSKTEFTYSDLKEYF